jgi:hypothetical protein
VLPFNGYTLKPIPCTWLIVRNTSQHLTISELHPCPLDVAFANNLLAVSALNFKILKYASSLRANTQM